MNEQDEIDNPRNFVGDEQRDYEQFARSHICPDRKPHDSIKFDVEVTYSFASAIGTNTYVGCARCGCMQDITDYGAW